MGYRYNLGATRACRFNNGMLEVEGPSERSFSTSVKINTEWQANMFVGPRVAFLIIDGDVLYIGLRDGSINTCRKDGCLIALHSWGAPETIVKSVVGYYRNKGITQEAWVDWAEPRLIHLARSRSTFILNPGLSALEWDVTLGGPEVMLANSLADVANKGLGLSVILGGGELLDEKESGIWRIDSDISTVPTLQF